MENSKFGSIVPRRKFAEAEDAGYMKENPLYDVIAQTPPPELLARFTRSSPPEVQSAFRTTMMEMIGSLPSTLFPLQVRTLTQHILGLMQTCIMTGYMFRNAQYRLSILKSLEAPLDPNNQLPAEVDIVGADVDMKGLPTDEQMSAQAYVDALRADISELRSQIEVYRMQEEANVRNELVGYIASLDSATLQSMTSDAGPEVIDGMRRLIDGVVGDTADPTAPVETAVNEVANLLLYNLVSGYFLREAEVKLSLERSLSAGDDGSSDDSASDEQQLQMPEEL